MDIVRQLGSLAFASRLKRLSASLQRDVSRVYRDCRFDFEARWFPVMYLLSQRDGLAVTEIASALGMTHPAVNQISNAMTAAGLLSSVKDNDDERRRLLSLTTEGRRLSQAMPEIWDEIRAATDDLLQGSGVDVLTLLDSLEQALREKSMYQRVSERLGYGGDDDIDIIPYRRAFRKAFRTLNLEWLETHFSVEPEDEKLLSHPEEKIIGRGGVIFFARQDGEIVGTVAMIPAGKKTFELAKMTVAETARRRGTGRRLAETAIAWAREKTAEKIILKTSPELEPALALYRNLGFTESQDKDTTYARSTIVMELSIATKVKTHKE